eukprot:4001553-Prymnesium_polylepis.1
MRRHASPRRCLYTAELDNRPSYPKRRPNQHGARWLFGAGYVCHVVFTGKKACWRVLVPAVICCVDRLTSCERGEEHYTKFAIAAATATRQILSHPGVAGKRVKSVCA